jgi:hypothetical protein
MIWINKDNTKPLYLLSIEDIIAHTYTKDIQISKTNNILLFSVTGNTATLVKGSVNDKEHLTHRQLLGVEILYESEKPNMFAILFNNTRIIASDKKILLDAVKTRLVKNQKMYLKELIEKDIPEVIIEVYITHLKKLYKYFKSLHEKLKEI